MSFVVLDTDVSSGSLRGHLTDPMRARLTGQTWCISFVTVGELTKWTVLRSWGPRKLAELADWRGLIVVIYTAAFHATAFDSFLWSGTIGTLILLVAYVLATVGCTMPVPRNAEPIATSANCSASPGVYQ